MPKGAKSNIANTGLRIFLQDMGVAYDQQRGLPPYDGKKHFAEVRAFFDERCAYCGEELGSNVAQDHLVPINKTSLGLHAWGNVVPACGPCNSKKQGKEWHAYLVQSAGAKTPERYEKVTAFIKKYGYAPNPTDLRDVAEELYAEVGSIAMTLINEKIKRQSKKL